MLNAKKIDYDLTTLLTKLYEIQEVCGSKAKTTKEEKRHRAQNVGMGTTKKAKKTGSKFLEVKGIIIDRLVSIQGLMQVESDRKKKIVGVVGVYNPKEVISRNAKLRQEISQVTEEWNQLDQIYKNEARKRNSKFSPQDLDFQQAIVQKLHSQIENIKVIQLSGYSRSRALDDFAMEHNKVALTSMDQIDFDNRIAPGEIPSRRMWDSPAVEIEMTDVQHRNLDMIKDRDENFDVQLDQIGEGLQDLMEIAQMQSEEVQRQNVMIENIEGKMEKTSEHITNVNIRMKETLSAVRGADKICVDIMCISLMLGLSFLMYKQLT